MPFPASMGHTHKYHLEFEMENVTLNITVRCLDSKLRTSKYMEYNSHGIVQANVSRHTNWKHPAVS